MKYLLTGGSGLLGTELQKIMQAEGVDFIAPSHSELDITKIEDCMNWWEFGHIIHCAAATGVAKSEDEAERRRVWKTNVGGVRNMIILAREASVMITFISTDYVFDGQRGNYHHDDTPNPINFYAFTKLIGEEIVRTYPRYQIIRTSFKPSKWKSAGAFIDQMTSADYVDIIAPLIWQTIKSGRQGVIHVGTPPKTTFELARRRNNKVKMIRINDIQSVQLPRDITLNLDVGG